MSSKTMVISSRASYCEHKIEGSHMLFMGHSYVAPGAKRFEILLAQTAVKNHSQVLISAAGGRGAPGSLWNHDRTKEAGLEALSSGEVDILGLTKHYVGSEYEDYERWVAAAVKTNPGTKIFMANPWPLKGGTSSLEDYEQENSHTNEILFSITQRLRRAFPETTLLYLNYGRASVDLKRLFERGELEGIEEIIGRGSNALYRDQQGHASPALIEMAALIWIRFLYQADISSIHIAQPYGEQVLELAGTFSLEE